MAGIHFSDWLTVRRVQIHAVLLAIAIWTAFFANLNTPGLRDRGGLIKGTDFLHFYTLGTLAWQGRGDLLYNIPSQTDFLRTLVPEARNYVYVPLYGPQVSLFFYPFAQLSYQHALTLWLLLNVLIYATCCYVLWKNCSSLKNYGWTVLILAVAFPGISQLLAWGQTSGFALLFFTLAYLALRSEKDFLAGLALGCLIFKPQLGLAAAVVFVFTRRWKVVSGALLSGLIQLGIGWLHYGTPVMRNYLDALTRTGQIMALLEPRPYQTHSLRTFWTMIIPAQSIALTLYLFSAVAVLILVVQCWRDKMGLEIEFSALLLATVLVSPHLTIYDLVILAPAFLLLGNWTLIHPAQTFSPQLQLLIYCCFVLFLFGPIVRFTHVQLSVIAMTAMLAILPRLPSNDTMAGNKFNPPLH